MCYFLYYQTLVNTILCTFPYYRNSLILVCVPFITNKHRLFIKYVHFISPKPLFSINSFNFLLLVFCPSLSKSYICFCILIVRHNLQNNRYIWWSFHLLLITINYSRLLRLLLRMFIKGQSYLHKFTIQLKNIRINNYNKTYVYFFLHFVLFISYNFNTHCLNKLNCEEN